MTTPVAASVSEVKGRWQGHYYVTVNGDRIKGCFDFNEAEGWADVWTLDAQGHVHLANPGDTEPAHHRITGAVLLVTDTPDLRAWFERHFPASAREEGAAT